ncbi:MopE-related protein [Flagellimonas sp.]|uniref:MopE-related protein n=1 Tax=Flagellimonas sp. TaxID=2058762 RepID=UPI003B5C1E95
MKNHQQFKKPIYGVLLICMSLTVPFACSKEDNCETKTYYLDADDDEYGTDATTETACTKPEGNYVLVGGDTEDDNPNINPGCTKVFYEDKDNDGYGVDNDNKVVACENPDSEKYTELSSPFDCDDGNPDINPKTVTYYFDSDRDTYGDPNVPLEVSSCNDAPVGYVLNNEDCNDENENIYPNAADITYYADEDEDGYGSEISETKLACDPEPDYTFALQGGDCDDKDDNINPGVSNEDDYPYDGIDSNCDGTPEVTNVWFGAPLNFFKPGHVNWADDPQYQDQITENIALARPNDGTDKWITNIQWWVGNFGQVPDALDLSWEYQDDLDETPTTTDVGNALPSGGPQGLRWAILEKEGDTQAWEDFDDYGILGDPTNFFSLNNIVSICAILDTDDGYFGVNSPFYVDTDSFIGGIETEYSYLIGKTLGVWIIEEDIYFTLTFTNLDSNGGVMGYTRSTPNN